MPPGKVKLTVVVTTDGKVKRVVVIGGHPLLVVAASDAAKQWLFAPASKGIQRTAGVRFQRSRVKTS